MKRLKKQSLKTLTFFMVSLLLMQSNVSATSSFVAQDNEVEQRTTSFSKQKSLQITVTELRDNSGLVYLGGLVSKADLAAYLNDLEQILGDEFNQYRENQAKRDHGVFHLTLINPNEYQFIDKSKFALGEKLTITLLGLGKVIKNNQTSYFVVAQSSQGQFFRQQQILSAKDFHVTLGFSPTDIYGASKGIETLLDKTYVENKLDL